jgi:hypothetical protein
MRSAKPSDKCQDSLGFASTFLDNRTIRRRPPFALDALVDSMSSGKALLQTYLPRHFVCTFKRRMHPLKVKHTKDRLAGN